MYWIEVKLILVDQYGEIPLITNETDVSARKPNDLSLCGNPLHDNTQLRVRWAKKVPYLGKVSRLEPRIAQVPSAVYYLDKHAFKENTTF